MSVPARNGRGPRVPLLNTPAPAPEPEPTGSEQGATPSLDGAVLAVQAASGKLVRNARGQIGARSYAYVTLDALTDEVLPLLVQHELLWKTFPTVLDGQPALRYRMTHVPSGEFDEDTMLLLCERTAQGQGSGQTYARRYSLTAYLHLTIDPDDDGMAANAAPQSTRQGAVNEPQPEPKAERLVTANQRTKLLEPRAAKAGLDAGRFANVILVAAGEEPRRWRDEQHAQETKDRLLEHLPARLKDAVLRGIDAAAAEIPADAFTPCIDCGKALAVFSSSERCGTCSKRELDRLDAEWMEPIGKTR